MSIAKAFVAAKKAFAPALKTSSNPHFRSKYADLAGCLEAVNDALLANGIAVYQETSECDSGVIVETVFLHESGETLRGGKLHVPAQKADPQGYGSALTYARRYSIMAACGIAAEDDDGNAASRPRGAVSNPLDALGVKNESVPIADPYLLRMPGKADAQPFPTWELWGLAYQDVAGKVARASKIAPADRVAKLKSLKESNQDVLERIDPVHRIKFTTMLAKYISELESQTADA